MRKADYATLAREIKRQRQLCIAQNKPLGDQELIALAHILARTLQVDMNAFLVACGLTP